MAVALHSFSPSLRKASTAEIASWPSVKASASTMMASPTTRLMENSPPSISGRTPSITTRLLPVSTLKAFLLQ